MIAGRERDNIPEAAYLIWEAEGRPEGRDMEHWLRAEHLIAARNDQIKDNKDNKDNKSELEKEPYEGPDDLKKISGIGPVMAKKLIAMGITRFAQIAAFDEADIDEIGGKLKCKAKMLNNDWVGQAKKRS